MSVHIFETKEYIHLLLVEPAKYITLTLTSATNNSNVVNA